MRDCANLACPILQSGVRGVPREESRWAPIAAQYDDIYGEPQSRAVVITVSAHDGLVITSCCWGISYGQFSGGRYTRSVFVERDVDQPYCARLLH